MYEDIIEADTVGVMRSDLGHEVIPYEVSGQVDLFKGGRSCHLGSFQRNSVKSFAFENFHESGWQ